MKHAERVRRADAMSSCSMKDVEVHIDAEPCIDEAGRTGEQNRENLVARIYVNNSRLKTCHIELLILRRVVARVLKAPQAVTWPA
jgi:hypothetical protein